MTTTQVLESNGIQFEQGQIKKLRNILMQRAILEGVNVAFPDSFLPQMEEELKKLQLYIKGRQVKEEARKANKEVKAQVTEVLDAVRVITDEYEKNNPETVEKKVRKRIVKKVGVKEFSTSLNNEPDEKS